MLLHELPHDHPFRNTPLLEIGAEYQRVNSNSSSWNKITGMFGIANKTFNDLSNVWTDYDVFRATKI